MTMIYTNPTATFSVAHIATRIADTIMTPLRAVLAWQAQNDTVSELSRMTNRELADLGLSRADLAPIAKAMVQRKAR